MKQQTVSKKVTWSGIGLHSGKKCEVSVLPAEDNFGIKFRRLDTGSDGWIPADVKYVSSTQRSTSLRSGMNEVMTVEHLLGALYGLGIDNAQVEVDGPEIPILDGSGRDFVRDLTDAGLSIQDADRKCFVLDEVVRYKDDSGAEYLAVPCDELEIDVLIDFGNKTVGRPHASMRKREEICNGYAASRTFVYSEDVIRLAEAGLIKGGHIDNAVVIRSSDTSDSDLEMALAKLGKKDIAGLVKRINQGFELHSDNELAGHKLYDLVGDLALIGATIKASIWAKKPGHTGNVAFARKLKEIYTRQLRLKGKPAYDPDAEPLYDTSSIMSFLPHRYPFLLVDKIIELSDTHVVGVKNLTFNELLFQGHFPNNPVFPGVLQMEALAQTGGILALNTVDNPSDWDTYFLKMENVKFKKKVVPGDTLILKMELLSPIRRGIVHMQGTAYVGNHIVSEGELTAQIIDRTTLK